LGTKSDVDSPYYVGFNVKGQQVGLNPNGHKEGLTGGVCFWHVDDIEAHTKALLDAGAVVFQATKDVGDRRLVASVKDQDGNVIGLIQDR
jgi:predicted enzyme related to lactoylglutathione lyase